MNEYNPDTVPPPGESIKEHLIEKEMAWTVFVEKVGLTAWEYGLLLIGEYPITEAFAQKLEEVLKRPVHYWMAYEKMYRDWKEQREYEIIE